MVEGDMICGKSVRRFFATLLLVGHPVASLVCAQATFSSTRLFGVDEAGPVEALLVSAPRFVAVGSGYVVVGDAAGAKVKVYDEDGDFLHTIGSKGLAPGELQRVADADIVSDSLWLVDESTMRISTFLLGDATYVGSYTADLGTMPRGIEVVYDHVVVLANKRDASGERMLLHEVDPDNGTIVQSFGGLTRTWSLNNGLDVPTIGILLPGSTCRLSDGRLYYAPRLYSGKIFGFRRIDSGWVADRELGGRLHVEQSYELLPDGDVAIHSESRGLFCLADGRVLHFSMQNESGKQMVAELFGPGGNLLAADRVDGIQFPEREYWDFRVTVMAVNRQQDLFIVDADDSGWPRLRQGRLDWNVVSW